jgi:hypothetical protein
MLLDEPTGPVLFNSRIDVEIGVNKPCGLEAFANGLTRLQLTGCPC